MVDEIADCWRFHLKLSEKCAVTQVGNSEDVELNVEDDGKANKFLAGFSIAIKDSTEMFAKFIAKQKAINLSNFISVKYGKYVRSYLDGITILHKDGTTSVAKLLQIRSLALKKLEFDLKDEATNSLLHDQDSNILYEHVNRGMKASEEEDPVTMIKEFYQVLEVNSTQELPQHLKKFKYLRHALSHKGPIWEYTISKLNEEFGINYFAFTTNRAFDYTSSTNIELLNKEALCLMTEVMDYLRLR